MNAGATRREDSLAHKTIAGARDQARTIGALIMREMVTRYGREGLGFLWLIAEPLAFCLGVITLWTLIKPEYEHGVRVGAFVMTGYMCLLLLRHIVSSNMNALQANAGLLFHQHLAPLHLFISRTLLEVMGTSIAFVVVYLILFVFGQVQAPHDLLMLYCGWFGLAWFSMGMALTLTALAIRYETVERLSSLFMYVMIPLSGVFFMLAYLPGPYREILLWIPIPHTVEMVRAGVFGEFVPTYYTAWYPYLGGTLLNALGLLLLRLYRSYVEVE